MKILAFYGDCNVKGRRDPIILNHCAPNTLLCNKIKQNNTNEL
jgi:hypothetical protein